MTTRCVAVRIVENDWVNVGVPPQGNLVPPQGNHVSPQEQAPIIPPTMTNGEIGSIFVTSAHVMTTQSQEVASPSQAMTAQANMDVSFSVEQNASTMDLC